MLHGTTENPLDKNRHSPNPVVPTPTGTSATKQSTTGNSAIQCKLHVPAVFASSRGGGGVLPYMAYTGMCHVTGYGFRPRCPKQGI